VGEANWGPLVVAKDLEHSKGEMRFYALGQTDAGRLLFVVFTIRKNSFELFWLGT
jgi:uncharacterized protein